MSHTHDIFLDHAATTPLHPEALGLMLPYFGNHYGTPSMPHTFGNTPRAALEKAREKVSGLINASPGEIIFTSSGTEANNMAVLGCAYARGKPGHIITSAIEHASVLGPVEHLTLLGFEVTRLAPDASGVISPTQLEEAIQDDTFLISILHAGNETGVMEPVDAIGRIARDRKIVFHCDCVQSAGRVPVDVRTLHADLLSISSHKLYGPKGVGALYVRKGTTISPILFGSGQEMGLRPGALNIPCIAAFGVACERARLDMEKNSLYVSQLRDTLEETLVRAVNGIRINGSGTPRTPHISSISFESVQADALAACLDLAGITVSARASFFSKRSSQTLGALGIPADLTFGTLRFSPGWENSLDDIHTVARAVDSAVSRLRGFARAAGEEPVCIVTFTSKNHVERSMQYLDEAGIPCTATVRPLELDRLSGPRTALAIPCSRQDETGRILGSHNISVTGMNRIDDLCRLNSHKAQRFWDKVADIKKGNP